MVEPHKTPYVTEIADELSALQRCVGDDGENFRSLTKSEVVKYMDRFKEPEDISLDEVEADIGITFYSM